MFLLVLMGISAFVGVLTLIGDKFKIGDVTYVEGRYARIVGMLLTLPVVYTFLTVILYAIIQMVTDLNVPADTSATMNMLQHVVTFGSILAALIYTVANRGKVQRLT